MKLFQIVFSFTAPQEAMFQTAANTEDEARQNLLDHPQIKELSGLEIKEVHLVHEDPTYSAADLNPHKTIN
jgi:hypothetical protein